MALDAEYFDSIYIDVVKKKYYNAGKVQAVFADIRRQAEELTAENERLRRQLSQVNDRKVELGDALLSAQTVYQEIVDRAKTRAAEITAAAEQQSAAILADARRQSESLLAESRRQEEDTVRRAEAAFSRMKELHKASILELNTQWQDFLCGLYPEEGEAPAPAKEREDQLPPDLEQKVGVIAEELFSLNGED